MSLVTFYTFLTVFHPVHLRLSPVRALISVENLSTSASLPPGALTLAAARPTVLLFPRLPKIIEMFTPYAVHLRRDFNPQGEFAAPTLLKLGNSVYHLRHAPPTPNLDLLLEALQSQDTSCLALLHDLFGFFVDLLALLLPF
jgi:hypothetical protein